MDFLEIFEALFQFVLGYAPEEYVFMFVVVVLAIVIVAVLLSVLVDYLKKLGLLQDGSALWAIAVLTAIVQAGLYLLALAGFEVDAEALLAAIASSGAAGVILARLSYLVRKLIGWAFSFSD